MKLILLLWSLPAWSQLTIWSPSTIPANPNFADSSSVEVGVKFRSDVSGQITGVRFYKGASNTGTHIGNLWNQAGTNLGSVTFASESATGWQQALFPAPVAIQAGSVYVASYFAPQGHYAATGAFFASTGADNPPLHALANSVSLDGVFQYSAASAFPRSGFNSTNYWVDVVFVPASSGSGPAAPTGVSATVH